MYQLVTTKITMQRKETRKKAIQLMKRKRKRRKEPGKKGRKKTQER